VSDLVIGDYTAAVTIDGSTNYLLIQPGSASTAYKKINRDVLLGVSGQPADISTAQNITNKTLDNTNILTLRDDRFTLQDSGDVTRQATFQLSGITAGNTRVMTLPDASTTLVGTGTTQTLTDKTLTSPTITGGTITNSTISVDAIAEYTSANGVTIDGLNIKDGKLNTNNSVVTANITDTAVTPAKLQTGTGSGWTWQAFTPSWTNLTPGNGTNVGYYIQVGKTVFVKTAFTMGNTSAMGTGPILTLPVTATASGYVAALSVVGPGSINDTGTQAYPNVVAIRWASTTTVDMVTMNAASTLLVPAAITATAPMTWATGDQLTLSFYYEAA